MDSQSRIETLVAVLLATKNGATRTRVMYERGLTSTQAHEYLSFLQLSDLVREEEGTRLFRPTEKGRSVLDDYDRISHEIEWSITA